MRAIACATLAACVMFTGNSARACSFEPLSFDLKFDRAATSFIGTVEKVQDNTVHFLIEKNLRPREEDAATMAAGTFSAPIDLTSCGIVFTPGQNWLYMGADQMSGSQLIADEFGRVIVENAAFAKEEFGYDYRTRAFVEKGTLSSACGPAGEPGFTVALDNRVSATLLRPLSMLDGIKGQEHFRSDGADAPGELSVSVCDDKGRTCEKRPGALYIGSAMKGTADGAIEWHEPGAGQDAPPVVHRHIFHVKIDPAGASCG